MWNGVINKKGQHFVCPPKGSTIQYEKKNKEFKMGYTFFFDFETIQREPQKTCACPIDEKGNVSPKCTHKSTVEAEHEAFAFSFLLLDRELNVCEDIVLSLIHI